jgi:hypothetical protein
MQVNAPGKNFSERGQGRRIKSIATRNSALRFYASFLQFYRVDGLNQLVPTSVKTLPEFSSCFLQAKKIIQKLRLKFFVVKISLNFFNREGYFVKQTAVINNDVLHLIESRAPQKFPIMATEP